MMVCFSQLVLVDTAGVQETCSQVLALDPRQVEAYKLRGYSYLLEQRFERAAADFQAGLRLRPEDDQLLAGHGQSLSGQGRFEASAAQFRRAIALAPRNAPYWNGLCWAQAGTGRQLDDALKACDRALRLEPGTPAPHNSRGLVLLRMRRFSQAIADYTVSLKLRPEQATARFGLGLARLWSGDTKGAADIREGRRLDGTVDRIFINMRVLPENCDGRARSSCPPGFPALAPPRRDNYVIARTRPDKDALRLAGLP